MRKPLKRAYFTTGDLAKLCNVSRRQILRLLSAWVREGSLRPCVSGRRRNKHNRFFNTSETREFCARIREARALAPTGRVDYGFDRLERKELYEALKARSLVALWREEAPL